ncbi:hypothetical protein K440DRAFT_618279 [Wilcoxina mikolae CBS 423.85]|nr:hypothetical protein K440DRAFT_618279 [Wilcoxina mikolae CBS 423.85]
MAFLLFLLLLDYSLQCPKTVPLLKISRDGVVVVLVFVVGVVGFHAFVVVELEFRELVLIVVYQLLLLLILLISSAKSVSLGSCSTIDLALLYNGRVSSVVQGVGKTFVFWSTHEKRSIYCN